MKCKLLLTCLLLIAFGTMNAQIKKGSILLGGSLDFETSHNKVFDYTTTTFGISPAIGKAIRDNLIAGVQLSFSTSRNKDSAVAIDDKSYGAFYFMRKYATLGQGFYLFGEGRLGGSYSKIDRGSSGGSFYKNEYYNIGLNFNPGIAYSITNKLQLELGLPNFLGINYTKGLSQDKSSTFSVRTALSQVSNVSIGLRILLNKGTN